MNPERDPRARSPEVNEHAFELLEHPEAWPEDPAAQAELARLLELHLALLSEGVAAGALGTGPAGSYRFPWFLSAAAAALIALPLAYHAVHTQAMARVARDQARIQDLAQRRGQDRLWAAFFQQSSTLIQEFSRHPEACEKRDGKDRSADRWEDRSADREIALALLQSSHGLASQEAPAPEAEAVRADLHAWLRELSLEDPCMDPQRAEELRAWATAHNLGDEAQRLGLLLKGDAP